MAAIKNWALDKESTVYTKCVAIYARVVQSYKDRKDADDEVAENWNVYNAIQDDNQTYIGVANTYLPIVRDSINARAKRAMRQLFPNKYKHVEAVGSDPQDPQTQLSILEHYIRTTKLKEICRSQLVSGDVTGNWGFYVDWSETSHIIKQAIKASPALQTVAGENLELTAGKEEVQGTEDKEIETSGPEIVEFITEDLSVIPTTCTDTEKAEIVTLKLRMSVDQVQEMVDAGWFVLEEKGTIDEWVKSHGEAPKDASKARAEEAGIKVDGDNTHAMVYWSTVRMKVEKDKPPVLLYVYFGGEDEILGIIEATQWGQKRPFITAQVDRIAGSFVGISKIRPVKSLQWAVNDFWNMGQDSATYSLLPVVMTDPLKNPNYAMMVYGLAAVWPVDPNSTKMAVFPSLWKDAVQYCQAIKSQIFESMEVNDMMMGAMPSGRKNNAMVGAQQQESSVSVIYHAERFEETMLDPLMERLFEYDTQYRDEDMEIITLGGIGVKSIMQTVPPQEWGERYCFQWCGTSFVMGIQQMQQQIATMNVLRGVPPQQLNGRTLDITPILEILVQNVFGVEVGQRVLVDNRNKYSVPVEIEDELMINGIMTDVHEQDDDTQHIQAHQAAAKASGDLAGIIRTHIQAHMQALIQKRQMAAAPPPGAPGVPGGGLEPGVAGTPRPGAQPMAQRPVQAPPGAIPPQAMGM